MAFQYLSNIPLGEAKEKYILRLRENGLHYKSEVLPVSQAIGKMTTAPVYANICAPHYHACAMDGIALYAALTFGASETSPVSLNENQVVRVDTGDPLPANCDAVVMIEDVIEEDGKIKLYTPAAPWQHIRQIGEDICAGDMALTSFSEVTPAAAGALLASGILRAAVAKTPVIGIIPTGDEIVPPSEDPAEGDIIEFNSTIFIGMLAKWGAKGIVYPIVKDVKEDIESAIRQALPECDMVLLIAGSSAGREDYASAAIDSVGQVFCHGVAIRPGKPVILGFSGEKPVIGLPGYPVSAIVVMEYIVKAVVDLLLAKTETAYSYAHAVLSRAYVSSLKYREFVRVRLGSVNDKLIAVPMQKGAGVVSSFVKADGLLDVPQNAEGYEAGAEVSIRLLKPLDEIKKALVITGSHDPLIDEAAEFLRRRKPDASVSSSHVGSMGGIFAIKRGEAHIAGTHLLDEKTGTYNIPYIEQYFPEGGVLLLSCAQRTQGFMVKKGNPKQIHDFTDLRNGGIRYVNRQKGSGTRVLFDYMRKKAGIDPQSIYGYEREEFTHTGVAALVASESADIGLGIYSAAQIYDLDFIPICMEQYDFLVSETAYNLPAVQEFIKTILSDEFAKRLDEMGGYELDSPGKILYGNLPI